MKACPTRAIRLQEGKAIIKGERCVDCGECYRVCPHEAVVPLTTPFSDLERFSVTVAIPSPVLYTQFGWEVMPNQVLLALKEIGFDYAYDLAWMCEMVNAAIEEHLLSHAAPRPMISTVCPAVIRLITVQYPELTRYITPIESPRELAAKRLRKQISEERGIAPEEIGLIHITSCPAKMISIKRPSGLEKSYLDGAVSIPEIYHPLLKELETINENVILQQSSGVGIGWAMTGGEVNGLNIDNCLSVSGVTDVIQILDEVEAGRLKEIAYLECLICPAGCVGGPQSIENRHLAKKRTNNLVEMFGRKSRVSRKMIHKLVEEEFFGLEKKVEPNPFPPLDEDPSMAIEKRKRMEEILPRLGGRECGACGAPDCRTLARDIVLGEADITDCVFLAGSDV
jgi:iron only hydrogenase large subunit-like protein